MSREGWSVWGRFRLVTLEEVLKRFGVIPLIAFSRLLTMIAVSNEVTVKLGSPDGKLAEDRAKEFLSMVEVALHECETSGLPMCCMALERLRDSIKKREAMGTLVEHGNDLNRRLLDELGGRVFFQLSEAERYEDPLLGWEDVITRFPDVQTDIEEAGRSFAVARYAASVFHLMRVLEGGLDGIAAILNPGDHWYSSWEAYLQKLATAREAKYGDPKDPDQRKWNRFFSDVERHLHAIKISVRNPVMHKLEKTYTEESAEDVYRQVRALMKHLAGGLPTQP